MGFLFQQILKEYFLVLVPRYYVKWLKWCLSLDVRQDKVDR